MRLLLAVVEGAGHFVEMEQPELGTIRQLGALPPRDCAAHAQATSVSVRVTRDTLEVSVYAITVVGGLVAAAGGLFRFLMRRSLCRGR